MNAAGITARSRHKTTIVEFLISLRFMRLNQVDPLFPNSDLEVDFDFVRLSAVSTVPEPNSWQLVSLTVLAISQRRLRPR